MSLDQERRIHRLLLQREREFTAVWRAECEINKILGAEYPFAEPPDLPSFYRAVKKKGLAKTKLKIPTVNSLIRNLAETENAYHILYESDGVEYSTFQIDTKLLRSLLPLNSEAFKLKLIETVQLESLEKYETGEVLWQEGDLFKV